MCGGRRLESLVAGAGTSPGTEAEMPIETINGTTLAYEVEGDGPPLLLIHGSWSERTTWAPLIPHLAERFRVIAYDRRGHGESTSDPEVGTIHDDVADAAALIERIGGPVRVLTSSFGGCIGLRLAGTRPDLVTRMVCHEPPLLGLLDEDPATARIAAEERRKLDETQALLEHGDLENGAEYFFEHVALGRGAWAALPEPVRAAFVANARTYLGELRDPDNVAADHRVLEQVVAPVLLNNGDQSPAFFAPVIERLAETLPNARRNTLAGAGHTPQISHPEEYSRIVSEFLLEQARVVA
jgi:pimeloyl-ACP methyl ester carboxylesterase